MERETPGSRGHGPKTMEAKKKAARESTRGYRELTRLFLLVLGKELLDRRLRVDAIDESEHFWVGRRQRALLVDWLDETGAHVGPQEVSQRDGRADKITVTPVVGLQSAVQQIKPGRQLVGNEALPQLFLLLLVLADVTKEIGNEKAGELADGRVDLVDLARLRVIAAKVAELWQQNEKTHRRTFMQLVQRSISSQWATVITSFKRKK